MSKSENIDRQVKLALMKSLELLTPLELNNVKNYLTSVRSRMRESAYGNQESDL